jgi:hypothetical protein
VMIVTLGGDATRPSPLGLISDRTRLDGASGWGSPSDERRRECGQVRTALVRLIVR